MRCNLTITISLWNADTFDLLLEYINVTHCRPNFPFRIARHHQMMQWMSMSSFRKNISFHECFPMNVSALSLSPKVSERQQLYNKACYLTYFFNFFQLCTYMYFRNGADINIICQKHQRKYIKIISESILFGKATVIVRL